MKPTCELRDYVCSLNAGSLLSSSAVNAMRTLLPVFSNLPSTTATTLVPNPRNPPVLTLMAVILPSGSPSTLSTVPTMLPSAAKTAKPIRGFSSGPLLLSEGGGVGGGD